MHHIPSQQQQSSQLNFDVWYYVSILFYKHEDENQQRIQRK